jgi:hypothetical protein
MGREPTFKKACHPVPRHGNQRRSAHCKMSVQRIPLRSFPEVIMHATESSIRKHHDYIAAKSGSIVAAERLVDDVISLDAVHRLNAFATTDHVKVVPIHALETDGVNEIPAALAT